MHFYDCKVVLYRNEPGGWVAEIPSIPGCHALMSTRESTPTELAADSQMIAEEYTLSASRHCRRTPLKSSRPGVRADGFRRVAAKLGFRQTRQAGSHERWQHPDGRATTIPALRGMEIGPPLFHRILRQLGIDPEIFARLEQISPGRAG